VAALQSCYVAQKITSLDHNYNRYGNATMISSSGEANNNPVSFLDGDIMVYFLTKCLMLKYRYFLLFANMCSALVNSSYPDIIRCIFSVNVDNINIDQIRRTVI